MLKPLMAVMVILVAGLVLLACEAEEEATPSTAPTRTPAAGTPVTTPNAVTPAGSPVAGDPARGRTLFQTLPCAGCHGANAEGGVGPNLKETRPSADRIRDVVRSGSGAMPAFPRGQVSDEELQHIIAYIQSLR